MLVVLYIMYNTNSFAVDQQSFDFAHK
jgi:hypothetical protein